jgi:cytochrome c peroxidase
MKVLKKAPHSPVVMGILGAALAAATVLACDTKKTEPTSGPTTAATAPLATATTPAATAAAVKIDRSLLVQFGKLATTFASPQNPITPEKVELGRQLYWDARLSKNQDVSCNSCHNLEAFGVDGKKTSPGHKQQLGDRNSPTVYNAAGHFAQFWDGRAATVEEQAKGPILNAKEMAMPNEAAVLAVLNSIPQYVEAFKKAFPGDKTPVSYDNLAKAIGAFERTLATPSKFDQYLGGDDSALNEAEKRGLSKFMDLNCNSCHVGSQLGGNEYKKLGHVLPWPDSKDLGRFAVTKADADKMMFKTAGLRNVAKTAPYYHDGSIATLEEAVKLMAKHQLGKTITDDEVKDIVAFLGSLTGEPTPAMTKKPELPPSTPKTPKANPG